MQQMSLRLQPFTHATAYSPLSPRLYSLLGRVPEAKVYSGETLSDGGKPVALERTTCKGTSHNILGGDDLHVCMATQVLWQH